MRAVTLSGRRDQPTDAVEDYCRLLDEALLARGVEAGLERVNWEELSWLRALPDLWQKSADWKGSWALVQYTALMWSRRGFPLLFPVVLLLLRIRKVRLAVVFHDVEPYGGKRLVDRLRRACIVFVMRCAYRLARASILCVPLQSVSWLPPNPAKAIFIPIGANVPALTAPDRSGCKGHGTKTIAVFGITGGGNVGNEISDIAFVAKTAAEQLTRIKLVIFGRGSMESEAGFGRALAGSKVEYRALGVLPAEEVSRVLAASDVALFVRGGIATQRGSAIASIACALPLVAYSGPHLPGPLAEAGVVPVPCGDREELAQAALRVLTDSQLWTDLHERSRRAHEKYFSWGAVGSRFLEVLHHA